MSAEATVKAIQDLTEVPATDHTTAITVGLIALAIALVKLLDHVIPWAFKRFSKSSGGVKATVVQLDPEVSRIIYETNQNVRDVHGVMSRTDNDGTPMVYSSRSGIETMREIAAVIADVARTQERLAASLDRLDEKFEAHDKSDAVTFSEIKGSMRRLENGLKAHDERAEQIQRAVEKDEDK